MDSESQLWLPEKPRKKDIRRMKNHLHPKVMEQLNLNAFDEDIILTLGETAAADLHMRLHAYYPVDEWKIPQMRTYSDGYDDEGFIGEPTFRLHAFYLPKSMMRITDNLRMNIKIDIAPSLLAESIASLDSEKMRTIAADDLIIRYAEEDDDIQDFLGDGDESEDVLNFDEEIDRQQAKVEIIALQKFRKAMIARVFDVSPKADEFDKDDLLLTEFPREEMPGKPKKRRRRGKK